MGSTGLPSRPWVKAIGPVLAVAVTACAPSTPGNVQLATSVAVADLGRDGRLDVVSLIASSSPSRGVITTSIQAASPPGTFQPPVISPTGAGPVAIAIGDLNGDGLPDVAVANAIPGPDGYSVDVQFQSASSPGLFGAPVVLPLGALEPRDLVLADLDGDGRLDVAVAALGSPAVQVFLQADPPGTFDAPTILPVAGYPTAVAAPRLDGAGRPALVATTANGFLSVLHPGAEPGTFLRSVDYPAGVSPAAVQGADLDGDGRTDLAVADYVGGLLVFLQAPDGSGSLLPPVAYGTLDYGSCSVALGDLDGDGRMDVVVANAGPPGYAGSVAVFLQSPSTPGLLLPPAMYLGYWGPLWVALGDLNQDGLLDLVVADGSPYVRFQVPGTPGRFAPPTWLPE